ncbi:tail fiber domain-containing protein [Sorangium sp. So ce375]|uniref:tail fiber domain-containing protein n=1 Tax=Sorangium sp. So ce375 TaxID=3133306 RepID=UPI003F5B3E0F
MPDQWMSPKYELPGTVTSRVRYFDGQYLKDQDFIDEQNHHTDRRHRHERLLHVAGILEGLNVTVNAGVLTVSPGAAVDDTGRQILLETARTVNVTPAGNGTWFLRMLFDELGDRIPNDNLGAPEATRFKQTPLIEVVALNANVPHQIVLGTVQRTSGVVSVGPEGRIYSGLRLPGPSQTSFALRAKGDGSPGWAELNASLSITGDASVTGNCAARRLDVITPSGVPKGAIGAFDEDIDGQVFRNFVIFASNAEASNQMLLRAPSFIFETYQSANVLDIESSAFSPRRLYITDDGRVAIGGSLPQTSARLTVDGDTRVSMGSLAVDTSTTSGLTLNSTSVAPSGGDTSRSFIVNSTGATKALVLVGNTGGGSSRSRVEVRQDLRVTGDLTTVGSASSATLGVSGNASAGALTVSGNTTLANLTISGIASAQNLTVYGSVSAATLSVSGNASLGSTAGSTVDIGKLSGTTVNIGLAGATVNLRGNVTTNSGVTVTSAAALKDHIQALPAEEALSVFRNLTPVTYAYKDDPEQRLQVGFIAEDVPDLVGTPDRKAIAPFSILAVLTRAVQAHDQALQALERRLDAMKGNPVQ